MLCYTEAVFSASADGLCGAVFSVRFSFDLRTRLTEKNSDCP